ncbi:hypothetical protein B0T24DRAFT_711816 [Lasiosphaeria ovina]|uniref:Uncharacterized protein n=1 Tax=Lasiosphaeria ovina TaxID=92902 RepID=A0AAE0JXK5_9PEZI|nr:hypothetical protein B0T24DRAFT_711816 [Lasiosphaeria ovina]
MPTQPNIPKTEAAHVHDLPPMVEIPLEDILKEALELAKVKNVKLDQLRTIADLGHAQIQQLVKNTPDLGMGGQVTDGESRIHHEVKSKSTPPRVLLGVETKYKVTTASFNFHILIHRFETNDGAEGYFEHLLRKDEHDLGKWDNKPMTGPNAENLALGHLALVKAYHIVMWCHNNFLFELKYDNKEGEEEVDKASKADLKRLLQFASKIEKYLKEGTIPDHVERPKPQVGIVTLTQHENDPKDDKYCVAFHPLRNAANFVLAKPLHPQLRGSVTLEAQSVGKGSFEVYVADKKTLVILDRYTVEITVLTGFVAAD